MQNATKGIRPDAPGKVTGAARYVADHREPGTLFAALVPSPAASGVIVSVDASEALALTGVQAVLTAQDLTDPDGPVAAQDIRYGVSLRDRPILADRAVRYVGEPVAVVIAETERVARFAASLVVVEIDMSDFVATLDAAVEPDASLVHQQRYEPDRDPPPGLEYVENQGNLLARYRISEGDVTAAFDSATQSYSGVYRFPSVYQYAM